MTIAQLSFPNFIRQSAKRAALSGEEILVDNFAGGGGASTGIEVALGRSVDIAINHDPEAIDMHRRNHPQTHHLCESVWDVDPVQVCAGRPVGVAWFSPDCKHFSRAKGAKPVSKRIRGLAWIAVRWAKRVRPRVIFLENVREFQEWGPLGEDNRPCPRRKGDTFKRFIAQLRNLGYAVETRILNAADFGAPTHRRRLFLIARCDGQPIVWPDATHGPGRPLPYRTAAECIDWSIPCPSIFGRKRPLAEKTMRRIAMGLKKYVLENPRPYIVQLAHGGNGSWEQGRCKEVTEPIGTVHAGGGNHAVVMPYVCGVGGRAGQSQATGGNAPVGTITAKNDRAIITPYLVQRNGEAPGQSPRATPVDEPINTVTPSNTSGVLVAPVLVGAGGPAFAGEPRSVEKPLGVCMAKNSSALVAAFLNKHYGGWAMDRNVVGQRVDQPSGTITACDHHSLTLAHLTKFYGTNVGSDLREPMPTVTATGQHLGEVRAFLIKYFGCGCGQTCTEPLHTVTTRDRFGLVTINGQEYAIADIGLRMLTPRELLRAQFGPELAADYILPKTASAAVAKIGNSVAPLVAAAIVGANVPELIVKRRRRKSA